MTLSGHSGALSLVDLLQANVLGRNTCRIAVATGDGHGFIFVDNGKIKHARYGDLVGTDAFFCLVTKDDVFFQVDSGLVVAERTIERDWESLVFEAMRLLDEDRLPTPSPDSLGKPQVREDPEGSVVVEKAAATKTGNDNKRGLILPVAFGSVAVAIVVFMVVSAFSSDARDTAVKKPTSVSSFESIATLEASELLGNEDKAPTLVTGEPPVAPDPNYALRPTIPCRILVDEAGQVIEAKVFRSRLDLQQFEDIAIEAIKSFRFTPAEKAGKPVRVWMIYPVTFR